MRAFRFYFYFCFPLFFYDFSIETKKETNTKKKTQNKIESKNENRTDLSILFLCVFFFLFFLFFFLNRLLLYNHVLWEKKKKQEYGNIIHSQITSRCWTNQFLSLQFIHLTMHKSQDWWRDATGDTATSSTQRNHAGFTSSFFC